MKQQVQLIKWQQDRLMQIRTAKALRLMCRNVIVHGLQHADQRKHVPASTWYREHATVRLAGPRYYGHTLAYATLSRLFRHTVVVYVAQEYADLQRKRISTSNVGVVTLNTLKKTMDKYPGIECVVLDNASIQSAARLNQFYQCVSHIKAEDGPICLVLLG